MIVFTDHVHQVNVHDVNNLGTGYYSVDERKTRVYGSHPIQLNTNIIQLNHYVIRSLEDYYNKCNRQIRNGWEKKIDYFYITDAVANEEIDLTIIVRHYPEYLSYVQRKMKEDEISKNNDLSMEEIMQILEDNNE
jgi:hypothetical protein